MNLYQKFAEVRKSQGLLQSDVASELTKMGLTVTKTQVSRWENGRAVPPLQHFFALCSLYHIEYPLEQFSDFHIAHLNEEGLRKIEEYRQDLIASGRYAPEQGGRRSLPLYLLPASAGTGQFLDSDAHEMIDVDASVPDSADYGIRVAGDSMEPRYNNGDIVWVSKTDSLDDGDIGVFFLNGDSYIKRFHQDGNGVQLISLNKKYSPIDIGASDTLRVFGRVVS